MSVFVHSWFRSSSTWLWAKFRSDQTLRAYYEPLNEELPLWTPELIRSRPAIAFKGDRHPSLDRHYFYEYLSLIEKNALNFKPEFSYQRYLLLRSEADDVLSDYLNGLISDAGAVGKRPVLCFCRSQMRSLWMSKTFGGVHIGQVRNPWDQWRSFGSHPYFHTQTARTAILLNGRVPGSFAHVPAISHASAGKAGIHFDMPSLRQCFALIWLASTLQVLAASELVVDTDLISVSEEARRELEVELLSHDLPIDLSDCRSTARPPDGKANLDSALREAAAALFGHASGLLPFDLSMIAPRQLRLVSPRTRVLLEDALRRSRAGDQATAV